MEKNKKALEEKKIEEINSLVEKSNENNRLLKIQVKTLKEDYDEKLAEIRLQETALEERNLQVEKEEESVKRRSKEIQSKADDINKIIKEKENEIIKKQENIATLQSKLNQLQNYKKKWKPMSNQME